MSVDWLWYRGNLLAYLLLPLSLLFWLVVTIRRLAYRLGLRSTHRFSAPLIVVGNITVGGTGKTPLVIWLVDYLKSRGYQPGIVARGYGGKARTWPQQVRPDSDIQAVGDEALLLAQRCHCPVCVAPDRAAAVDALLSHADCDIVVSDDGLQHYAMHRDLEIAVIDGERQFGNGFLLPAGPLREPQTRLAEADLIISLGPRVFDSYTMVHKNAHIYPLDDPASRRPLADAAGARVHAVAGIGNPQRFFDLLENQGLKPIAHPFPDHHRFIEQDLNFDDELPVFLTEKDAVKCDLLGVRGIWVVQIDAQPEAPFIESLNILLQDLESDHG